jgi:large subunit ribosomal protein L15
VEGKMRLNNLTVPKGSRKKVKRVGRGSSSGKGKTCGRGQNGAKSRTGYTQGRGFEGGQMPIQRKVPKRGMSKGSKQNMMRNIRIQYKLIKTSFFNRFDNGTKIDEKFLISNSIIKPMEINSVKILSDKKLEKKINFIYGFSFSENAIAEIESQGGTVTIKENVRGSKLEVSKKNNIKIRPPIKEGHTSTLDVLKLRCVPDSSLDNDRPPENDIVKGNKRNTEEKKVGSEEVGSEEVGNEEKTEVRGNKTMDNGQLTIDNEKQEIKRKKKVGEKEKSEEKTEDKEVGSEEVGSKEKTEDKGMPSTNLVRGELEVSEEKPEEKTTEEKPEEKTTEEKPEKTKESEEKGQEE